MQKGDTAIDLLAKSRLGVPAVLAHSDVEQSTDLVKTLGANQARESLFSGAQSVSVVLGLAKDTPMLSDNNHSIWKAHTVLPLSIQTLCKLHRHVALPNDIIFSIRRFHSKHLDCEHPVASNFFTMLFCILP